MQVVQLLTPLNFLLRLVLSRVTFSGCRPCCSQERTSTSSSHSSNYSPAYVQFHHEQIHTDASCSFLLQDSCYSMFWGFFVIFPGSNFNRHKAAWQIKLFICNVAGFPQADSALVSLVKEVKFAYQLQITCQRVFCTEPFTWTLFRYWGYKAFLQYKIFFIL